MPSAHNLHKTRQRHRQTAAHRASLLSLVDAARLGGSPEIERVAWASVPASVDPARGGGLDPAARGARKRWQIESLYTLLSSALGAADAPLNIVDFGAGSGNCSLALAALLPRCHFTLVDRNPRAVAIANERARAAGLTNVDAVAATAEAFDAAALEIDVVLAVHACGAASDDALEQALRLRCSYVLVPCCVGKLRLAAAAPFAADPAPRQARSALLRGLVDSERYLQLAAFADHDGAAAAAEAGDELVNRGKRLLERDRNARAEEEGWRTAIAQLSPAAASTKRDVLVGIARAKRFARPPPPATGLRAEAPTAAAEAAHARSPRARAQPAGRGSAARRALPLSARGRCGGAAPACPARRQRTCTSLAEAAAIAPRTSPPRARPRDSSSTRAATPRSRRETRSRAFDRRVPAHGCASSWRAAAAASSSAPRRCGEAAARAPRRRRGVDAARDADRRRAARLAARHAHDIAALARRAHYHHPG